MSKMTFNFGYINQTTVEVTNRQQCVEYKVIKGFDSDERSVRAAIGDTGKDIWSDSYSGFYSERGLAIERLKSDILELKKQLNELEFALKVTKKEKWIKVK